MQSSVYPLSRCLLTQVGKLRVHSPNLIPVRPLSTSQTTSWLDETVYLPVGNNGSISVNLTRSLDPGTSTQNQVFTPGSNVIVYLPPGPLCQGYPDNPRGKDERLCKEYAAQDSHQTQWHFKRPNDHTGPSTQQMLAAQTSATVVTVNYRLGAIPPSRQSAFSRLVRDGIDYSTQSATETVPEKLSSEQSAAPESQQSFFQYPTPIHDTLCAFDWIQSHLAPAQLGIYGSHIGGSLALMLALTEAQSVKAVATHLPICDWTSLDEYCLTEHPDIASANHTSVESTGTKRGSTRKRNRKSSLVAVAPADLLPLLDARRALFPSPERCFDAFASPMLFLRSAGREVPRVFPEYLSGPEYPVPVLKSSKKARSVPDDNLLVLDELSLTETNETVDCDGEDAGQTTVRRRKALSRWPPYGLDYGAGGRGWSGSGVRRLEVTLPWVRIDVTGTTSGGNEAGSSRSVLADQGEEMVSIMRRACFFGKEKGFGERRVVLAKEIGQVGLGLAGDVGHWLGAKFDGTTQEE
ncbi:hypothetical protein PDE_08921 [Penicillium oxalicum 114-2]|uniref:Uncharacterized protein n=1 Tax=Penicillium oxalicum (strain 114-2 / CGMCC 5302) TaxID=933388 RepID=S7ZU69_PENO1|nr:hypothetical protein PDE_08921 [Penicillium oxalicum 114-2]